MSHSYPISCQISHGTQTGSLNIFFDSNQHPNSIYGVTCAHILQNHNHLNTVDLRQKGSNQLIIKGTISKIYNKESNSDLATIEFSRNDITEQFTLNRAIPLPKLEKKEILVVGLRNKPVRVPVLEQSTSLRHQDFFFENVHCLKGIGHHGDSGTTIFLTKDDNFYCLGQLTFVKKENTYITNFQENNKLLSQDFNITSYYFLTNK